MVDVAIIYLVKRFTTLAFVLLDPSASLDPAPCCSPTYKSVADAKRDCVSGRSANRGQRVARCLLGERRKSPLLELQEVELLLHHQHREAMQHRPH